MLGPPVLGTVETWGTYRWSEFFPFGYTCRPFLRSNLWEQVERRAIQLIYIVHLDVFLDENV